MRQDIDSALHGWDYKPGIVQARLVQAKNGRQVIQIRLDLGILQMETSGRPDGTRPHGYSTYYEYLQQQSTVAQLAEQSFSLSEEQCEEADREFVQFYHRRICWLALRNYERAVADADHTLAFMDFVRDHSPHEEYTQAHEQYRGFVLFHRTQAAAALAAENDDAESAIDELAEGISKLREMFVAYGMDEEQVDEDNPMIEQLQKMADALREQYGIQATLREKLAQAVANEEYEVAARLRDQLRKREQ